jgi:hypothetical protein
VNEARAAVDPRTAASAIGSVLRHPSLWVTALVQLRRMAPDGWWRRRPFLPLPDPEYLRFRLQTMYGDPEHAPEGDDLVTYLRWVKRFPDSPA